MAVSYTDFPVELRTAHGALFQSSFVAAQAFSGARSFITTTRLPPGRDRSTGHWFGTPPRMVNVDDDQVQFEDLAKFEHTIIDGLFKGGIKVKRRALEYDQLKLLTPRIQQLGVGAEYDIMDHVLSHLIDNTAAYDGAALFANTRVIGDSANIDNDITEAAATGTTPTVAEMQSAIANARSTMAAFEDDRGRKRNQTPDTILYDAAVEQTLFQALSGASTPGSTQLVVPASQNGIVTMNGYQLFRNPKSDNAAEMFFLNTKNVVKPLILQMGADPVMEMVTGNDSVPAIIDDEYIYSVRGRWGSGPGEPRDIIRLTFT